MTLEYSNIFDAITEDKAEASELQTRSDLMIVYQCEELVTGRCSDSIRTNPTSRKRSC